MIGIYKITSPSDKVYIGQSIDIDNRFYTYKRLIKRSIGRSLYNSLLKYGFDSHEVKIIHELPSDVEQNILNEYERFYISQYKACGVKMMNLTDGGEGSVGYKHTDESRNIMKAKAVGRIAGDKNPNYGKGLHGKNNPMYGKKRPKEILDKLLAVNQKPVIKYSLSGELLAEYKSGAEAERETGVGFVNISSVCRKRPRCKTAGGYVWRFKDDPFGVVVNKNFMPVLQFTKDQKFIKDWASIKEAMISLNIGKTDPSNICSCCNNKRHTAYGFIWKYKPMTNEM